MYGSHFVAFLYPPWYDVNHCSDWLTARIFWISGDASLRFVALREGDMHLLRRHASPARRWQPPAAPVRHMHQQLLRPFHPHACSDSAAHNFQNSCCVEGDCGCFLSCRACVYESIHINISPLIALELLSSQAPGFARKHQK